MICENSCGNLEMIQFVANGYVMRQKQEGESMERDTWQLLCRVNIAIIKIRGAYAAWAREHGVNYHETLLFYLIGQNGTCTQKQICDSYLLPKQTVNNVITSLKKQGYLMLVSNEKNGREKQITLTDSGKTYAESIMRPLFHIEEQAIRAMGEENLYMMTDLALRYGRILDEVMSTPDAERENSGV